jgi:hypothetical protein
MAKVKENNMLAQVIAQLANLEAFCLVCPSVSEVTAILEEIGFHLAFDMRPMTFSKQSKLATLPAQYHYRDAHGTELIFLAGQDYAEEDEARLPSHASRWWIYPGTSQYSYNLVMQTLRAKFLLNWI